MTSAYETELWRDEGKAEPGAAGSHLGDLVRACPAA
jgi:hypothetical protein